MQKQAGVGGGDIIIFFPFPHLHALQYRHNSKVSILFACEDMKKFIVTLRLVWLSPRNRSSKGHRERYW